MTENIMQTDTVNTTLYSMNLDAIQAETKISGQSVKIVMNEVSLNTSV